MRMPNVDGQELIRRLLEIDPGVSVIAVSGTATELGKAEGVGAFDSIVKPIHPDELVSEIQEALDREDEDVWESR